jgi:hypothetical protein
MVADAALDPTDVGGQEPAPGTDERKLVVGALVVLAALAAPAAVVAYVVVGWDGAASALLGLGFVLLLFGGSAVLLVRAAVRGDNGITVLVVGALVRLPMYLVSLMLLSRLSWVHGRSLALSTAAAVAVTLAYELRLIARSPRMFWIDPEAAAASAASDATRS